MATDSPTERGYASTAPQRFLATAIAGGFIWSVTESVDLWATSEMRLATTRLWLLFFLTHLLLGVGACLAQMGIVDLGARVLVGPLRRLHIGGRRMTAVAVGLVLFGFHGALWTAAALTGFERGLAQGLLIGLGVIASAAFLSKGVLPWRPGARQPTRPWFFCLSCFAMVLLGHLFNREWNPKIYFPQHAYVTFAALTCATFGAAQGLLLLPRRWSRPVSFWQATAIAAALLGAPVLLIAKSNDVGHALFTRAFDAKGVVYVARKLQGQRYGATATEPAATEPVVVRSGSKRAQRVLLMTIDALRTDHLGTYGYHRGTSPAIDRFAQTATIFDWAWAAGARTSIALESIFASSDGQSNLTRMLQQAGIPRLAVLYTSLAEANGSRWMASVADRLVTVDGNDDARLATSAIGEIDAGRFQGFMWVHFFSPHHPYVPHEPNRFGTRTIDLYDGEIAEADRAVERVLQALDRNGLADTTAVIIAGDHGEEFRDHGGETHGWDVYNELLHIPLIIRMPGGKQGHEHTHVTQRDFPLTILDLFGVSGLRSGEARSLVPALAGEGVRPDRTVMIGPISSFAVGALMSGRWKLVYSLFNKSYALFDLEQDPAERLNLFEAKPQIAGPLERTLHSLLQHPGRPEPEIAGTGWSHHGTEGDAALLTPKL